MREKEKFGRRTKFLNLFRSVFMFRPLENLLVKAILKNPKNELLRKVQPNNHLYPKKSIRKVNREGINYELDISDYQEWLIYYLSDVDEPVALFGYVQPGDHVLDVGGNIGQSALRMAQRVKPSGHVTSFEPYPDTYRKYLRNLELNPDYGPNISVHNLALGSEASVLKMYKIKETNSGGNRILQEQSGNVSGLVEVNVITMDEYVERHNVKKVDFIKIDVEGFEYNVLIGGHATLAKFKPKLYIELNDQNLRDQGSSANKLLTFLEKLNYKIIRTDTHQPITAASFTSKEHIDIFCE